MTMVREKPLVVFDGECGFCRRSVEAWRGRTDERVEYAPFQEVAGQFAQIPREEFQGAVQLFDVDGHRYSGAEAVFRMMAYVPGKGVGLWMYRHVPLFAQAARFVYRWVAANRGTVSAISWWLHGRHVGPSTFVLSRQLFLRLLGAVYLIAFASFWMQARGLVGKNGILPVADYLRYAHHSIGQDAYWRLPTLCWWNSSDEFLTWGLCGGGVAAAVLLIVGVLPTLMLLVLWVFYLSIACAGQTFMNFQWDALLLETGLVALLYAPLRLRLDSTRAAPPSGAIHFVIKWLLLRLMLQSGIVKLTAGDSCWNDLTALLYHYETQPLPVWTSWYAHHLPVWFQKSSVALMFLVELAAPVALLGPRRIRHSACAGIVGLMAFIGVTGNYNFFNLLTVVLCVAMLDDALLRRVTPKYFFERQVEKRRRGGFVFRRVTLGMVAAFLVVFSAVDGLVPSAGRHKLPDWLTAPTRWEWWNQMAMRITPFRSVNNYGLFRVMTKTRPEIIVEGSIDGRTWKEYEFKWKPGDLSRAPGFVQPHQPRLDWQMWFAALGQYNQPRQFWFRQFLMKLLDNDPEVLGLMEANPFADQAPRHVRAKLYEYEFTNPGEGPGWWRRKFVRMYSPTRSR